MNKKYTGLSLLVEQHLKQYYKMHRLDCPPCHVYDCVLKAVERPLITETLNQVHGNQAKAAHILGLSRNTLKQKMDSLGIEVIKKSLVFYFFCPYNLFLFV